MVHLPFHRMQKCLWECGAECCSKDAALELQSVTEGFIEDLAGSAVMYARHAGRKTVTREDIELAVNVYITRN